MLLWALGGAVVAWIGLRLLHPIAVLWHELGHAMAALAVSSGAVELDLGRFEGDSRTLGRLRYRLTLPASSGRTVYEAGGVARWARLGVAVAGPIASAGGVLLGFYLGVQAGLELWIRFVAFVFAWAHLRVLLFTCLPSRAEAGKEEGTGAGAGPDPSLPARGADWRDLCAIWSGRDSGRSPG